jgi:hypothetical protein
MKPCLCARRSDMSDSRAFMFIGQEVRTTYMASYPRNLKSRYVSMPWLGHPHFFNCVPVAVLNTQATVTVPCATLAPSKLSVGYTNRKVGCGNVQHQPHPNQPPKIPRWFSHVRNYSLQKSIVHKLVRISIEIYKRRNFTTVSTKPHHHDPL